MDSDYEDLEINFRDAGFARSMLESRENLSVLVQRDPDSIIVADLDGHAVGNVYFLKTGDAAYGYNLAIRKSHRKKGIARHLPTFAKHWPSFAKAATLLEIHTKEYRAIRRMICRDPLDTTLEKIRDSPELVKSIALVMSDPNENVRGAAIYILTKAADKKIDISSAFPEVVKVLQTGSVAVRQSASEFLSNIVLFAENLCKLFCNLPVLIRN